MRKLSIGTLKTLDCGEGVRDGWERDGAGE